MVLDFFFDERANERSVASPEPYSPRRAVGAVANQIGAITDWQMLWGRTVGVLLTRRGNVRCNSVTRTSSMSASIIIF